MEEERQTPETEPDEAAETAETAGPPEESAEALRQQLEEARERVTQLERERCLLSQGVAEEDLDYYAFKIGKLTTEEKPFDAAAKEFLRQRGMKRGGGFNTGASLETRPTRTPSTSDTMNRLLRGG